MKSSKKGYCKFRTPDRSGKLGNSSCLSSDWHCEIVENNSDAIITCDLEGKITGWNSGAEHLYLYTSEEVLGKNAILLFGDNREEQIQILEAMRKGEVFPDLETYRKRKDGSLIDISASYFPIKDSSGNISEYCTIHRDITERKKMQTEMIRTKELAAVGQLAAGVAHALNTPLAAILISIQMLKEDLLAETDSSKSDLKNSKNQENQLKLSQSAIADLERIERQSEKCRLIVKNLLNLARPPGAIREKTDIHNLLTRVVEGIEPTLRNKNIEIVLELDSRHLWILCDPKMIEELIVNLISNAGDAILSKGTIKITTYTLADSLILKIKDTGSGIEPDILPHIFDPFYTTKEIGKGTGLGLALCYRIVQDHKGSIKVDSQPKLGSTFTITLPGVRVEDPIPVGAEK